jgi:hypothetical protein
LTGGNVTYKNGNNSIFLKKSSKNAENRPEKQKIEAGIR